MTEEKKRYDSKFEMIQISEPMQPTQAEAVAEEGLFQKLKPNTILDMSSRKGKNKFLLSRSYYDHILQAVHYHSLLLPFLGYFFIFLLVSSIEIWMFFPLTSVDSLFIFLWRLL